MKDLPILVTGAAGFIGSRLVELADRAQTPVISVDKTEHFSDRPEHRAIQFGQVVDRDDLFKWLEKKKPAISCIFHLGACTDTTQMDTAYLNKVNYEYSQQIWNFASKHSVPLVYASSAATYGDGGWGYNDDESLIPKLQPLNPYGESKQRFDRWVLEQEKVNNVPPQWSAFKFFNVYGFGERHKGKMASVALHAFDQIKKSGRVKLFKSHRVDIPHGHQMRDFIYIDDVVEVLRFAQQKPIRRGIFNLGTGQARNFLDLVSAVFKCMGNPEQVDFFDTPAEIRERYQYFTEARMERLRSLGYERPFLSLEEGVSKYMRLLGA